MAAIRHEIVINAAPTRIWDVLADVGAVHERLLPGRVVDTRIEGSERFLTFPDGHVIEGDAFRAALPRQRVSERSCVARRASRGSSPPP
ncbi:hypothetical protein [Nocardia panacis]|uniref:hypothetical protein n=1 Tax=Nocardia panacis TaxID=2340916 RepID=UPI00193A75F2|nr:hypothetical protein [Nocardia panacis]